MSLEHGSLEGIILNTLWRLEEKGESESSVNIVFEAINRSEHTRAYTTIKTVMDRLFEKGVLSRFKMGKKFFYKTAYSKDQMVRFALERVARQYFDNNMSSLLRAVEKEANKEALAV